MRALGVDFGLKRIGLAVGDSDPVVTGVRPALRASGSLAKDAAKIAEIASKEEAEAVVLGIPRNLPGLSDKMERICIQLGERIKERGWNVYFVDEALTSIEGSERVAAVYKPNARRKNIDGEAARLILERFFHGRS